MICGELGEGDAKESLVSLRDKVRQAPVAKVLVVDRKSGTVFIMYQVVWDIKIDENKCRLFYKRIIAAPLFWGRP